jgi:hypothetical protein
MPVASPTTTPTIRQKKWDVIHACDNARQVADVLDAQATANIRAYVLSRPHRAGDSLLHSWNEVRKWRAQLDEHAGDLPFDSAGMIVHAHLFTAGMAAIRGDVPTVYDVDRFLDQSPDSANRSWLARSFRAAEQFLLAQSAAIIVHRSEMKKAVLARGVHEERLFYIPAAAPIMPDTSAAETLRFRLAIAPGEFTIFCEYMDAPIAAALLAYRSAGNELRVLLSESASAQMAVLPHENGDPLSQVCVSISGDHHDAAISAADLVIAADEESLSTAMVFGKPSLALDSEHTRALTPDGAGVVWCDPGDAADRARRLAHLLRERNFRKALADSARRYICERRSLERVGKMYEEVYCFASQAKKQKKDVPPNGSLVPATINI